MPPKIHADWRNAGYGGDGSPDDMGDQAGDSFTVTQSFDDGLPDTVTSTSGATASGTLSLPDVTGRYGTDIGRVHWQLGQTLTSDGGSGTTTQGVVPTLDNLAAMTCQIIWISWHSLAVGAGSAATLTQYPPGYDVIIPQFTDGDLNFVLLARQQAPKIAHENSPVFYFSQPVNWMCGWMSCEVLDKALNWMPAQIVSATAKTSPSTGTNHAPTPVAVGATGSSGGVPCSIFLSYGVGGVWSQGVGGFQVNGSTSLGKQNYAFVILGPSGFNVNSTPGIPGNYSMNANTALASGPTLQTLDGTFQTGVAGWTPVSSTFAASAAHAHSGTQAALQTVTGTPTQVTWRPTARVAVTGGSTFRGWVWAFSTASTPSTSYAIDWYDSGGVFISTTASPATTLAANTWTRLDTGPVTAPAGAVTAAYGGTLAGTPATGKQVWWDDVDFRGMETILASFSVEAVEFDIQDGRQYFSPYNPTSPVQGFDRDVAPMSAQMGILTDDGPQYQTVFTGQMSSVDISGRTADMEGVSASRLAMMASVQLPMVNGQTAGANMTWPVTYAFGACGLYASPPPTPYARYWATLHGSNMYNFGSPQTGQPMPAIVTRYSNGEIAAAGGGIGQYDNFQPSSVSGPFVLGMYAARNKDFGQLNQMTFRPANGWWPPLGSYRPAATYGANGYFDALSQANNTGRFTCWVRGDGAIVNPTTWGIAQTAGAINGLMAFRMYNKNAAGSQVSAVECGIELVSPYNLYVLMQDSHGNNTFTATSSVLPMDGNWHFCSWTWNWQSGVFNTHVDNVTFNEIGTLPTTIGDLPVTEASGEAAGITLNCQFDTWLPVSEAMLECGTAVYTNPYNWSPSVPFAPTAIVRAVDYELAAIVEPAPMAAWDIMVRYAQAAFAMYRCDEQDRICWLPPSYFGEPQLTPFATDAFTRTLAGTWGSADLGGAWTLSAGTFGVGSGFSQMTLPAAGTMLTAALTDVNQQDFDIRWIGIPRANVAGAELVLDLATRYVDATHYVAYQMRFQTDLTVDAYVVRNQGSGDVVLGSNIATALTYNSSQFINVRCKAVSGMLYMKVWNVQNIEPIGWTLVCEDDAPLSGSIMFRAVAAVGNTNMPLLVGFDGLNAQFQSIEVIDTDKNAQDLQVILDPSKIRNDATVQFADTSVGTNPASVLAYSTAVTVPNKISTVVFALDVVQAQTLANPAISNLTLAQVTAGAGPAGVHWAGFNTKNDGTGTYLNAAQVKATVLQVTPASATVQFNNLYGKTVYMVNNASTGIPFLQLLGYVVNSVAGYTTVNDPASIARRGDRTVSADIEGLQRRDDATRIAGQLISMQANPRGNVSVHVMGNPSRVPGNLVQIADAQGTGAAGIWLILSVKHVRSNAEYTQDLLLVQILPTAMWDISNWDESAWGE
jgi:hypothetical protein